MRDADGFKHFTAMSTVSLNSRLETQKEEDIMSNGLQEEHRRLISLKDQEHFFLIAIGLRNERWGEEASRWLMLGILYENGPHRRQGAVTDLLTPDQHHSLLLAFRGRVCPPHHQLHLRNVAVLGLVLITFQKVEGLPSII